MRSMGQKPVGPSAFREYLRVVRGLLDGEEVDYTHNGETRPIRLQDRQLEGLNLDDRIPVYVGANGPKALAATGAYGDGRQAVTEPTRVMQNNMERAPRAEAAGRALPQDFHTSVLTYACVLKAGESLESDRVIEETGPPSSRRCILVRTDASARERRLYPGRNPRGMGRLQSLCRWHAAQTPPNSPRGHCAFCRSRNAASSPPT